MTEKRKTKRNTPDERSSRFRGVWVTIAGIYLVTVWLDGVGSTWPAKMTPRPWVYFAQVAALFVNSSPKVIDYRAEGWSCSERRWTEIDVRPHFQIDSENKENRFQRALQFYRKNRMVMQALDDFVVKRQNATGPTIGGVRFASLRLDYPKPGQHVAPYERNPLATYSKNQRHDWYWTPKPRRIQRCGHPDTGDGSKDDEKESGGAAPKDDHEGEP